MRSLLLAFASFVTLSVFGQTVNKGDNLQIAYRKIGKPYFFKAPGFTPWAEGTNMWLIGNKPNQNSCDYLFLALQDTTLIGVFNTKQPNYFLFDTEGNSILNTKSDYFFLPLWTVKRTAKISASDTTILVVLDKLYDATLQADDGQLDETTIRKYRQFQTDKTLPNRHIALLFDDYQTMITETAAKGQKPPADVCVPLMKSLAGECISLYNQIPAVVCVYMGEALESAGMLDQARAHFKMALQFYPNSIPLQVYNYRLEQDTEKRKQMLAELKRKYPKHWMVKDL